MPAPLHEPRILIVDDDPSIRAILIAALKREHYTAVQVASGGVTAQEILKAGGIDLVITDISMPDLDGLTLMQWGLENCPGPAWIILSGEATFGNAVQAVKLGAFDFITKPLSDPDSFFVSVRNALRQKQLLADRTHLADVLAGQVATLEQSLDLLSAQAQIIQRDLHRAELIQRALLPEQPPKLGRFAVNALYRPSHEVGGDLYDVQPVDDRHWAFYIADAAGHGISAAMVAVLFKSSLVVRDGRTGAPLAPAENLAAVNARLFRQCAAPGLFITAALCLLDAASGELTVSSGGHPPLLLQRAGGDVESIPHTGPALGLAERANFGTFATRLGPGDRLLLYTDGLTDPHQTGRGISPLELGALLAAPADRPQARLDRLAAEAFRRAGAPVLEDDLTLLLVSEGDTDSELDHGGPRLPAALPEMPPPSADAASAGDLVAQQGEVTFIRLAARCVWAQVTAFHDTCATELRRGRSVVVDLDGCQYMDSTFLGTLHELAAMAGAKGTLILQRMSPAVARLCDDLGLAGVLSLVAPAARPLPASFSPLAPPPASTRRARERVLAAHELLATLSDDNRRRFSGVIEELHRGPAPGRET